MAASDWAAWRGEIAKACDGSHQTIDSIEADIAEGRALPVYGQGCCFIVEIHQYPGVRSCQVTWGAGELKPILAAMPHLHDWARGRGCTEMLIEGRAGWARALRDLGYETWSVTVRKALHGHLQ